MIFIVGGSPEEIAQLVELFTSKGYAVMYPGPVQQPKHAGEETWEDPGIPGYDGLQRPQA